MDKAGSVEITVISAEELRLANRFLKKNTFVIVRMDSRNYGTTSTDSRGGSFPSWNEQLRLPLPSSARSVCVEVHCKTAFGVKMIGKAKIPVSDFAGNFTPGRYLQFLSYRLRDKEGRKNGIVNLSVRMDVPESVPSVCRIPGEHNRQGFTFWRRKPQPPGCHGNPCLYSV